MGGKGDNTIGQDSRFAACLNEAADDDFASGASEIKRKDESEGR